MSLERVSCLFFEKQTSSCSFSRCPSIGCPSILNILHSVFNLIVYLHLRVPGDWLETLFDLFGRSLPLTIGIPLSACWTTGTSELLNQTPQLNRLFGDIMKDFVEQNYHLLCSWEPWDCKQRKIFKGKWFILSLFLTFVTPLLVWKMFVMLL